MNNQKVGNISNSNVSGVNINTHAGHHSLGYRLDSRANISLIISTISLVCSIISIGAVFHSDAELKVDYMGVIIGMLSFLVALVTIIFGYNIYSLKSSVRKEFEHKLNEVTIRLDNSLREQVGNSISDAKCQLYYSASLINKESNQIGLELHNLFLSINECLNNDITTYDEYNIIQDRIYEIIDISKKQEQDSDIKFVEPQLSNYIEISKKMIGEKSNEILQYLLLKKNQIKSDKS